MSRSGCESEAAILNAARSGEWSPDLRAHAARCPGCADLARVAQLLRGEADSAAAEVTLPDPGAIWWKAQRRAREAGARRATWPIRIVERVAYVSSALLLGLVAVREWPRIEGWLDAFPPLSTLTAVPAPGPEASLTLIVGAGLWPLTLLVVFGLYLVWAEE